MLINPNYPYFSASPEAIVECKCFRIRCLEIKCLYSHRGDSVPQMLGKKPYLHKNAEGKVQLKSNHSYYYQVQTQLLVTGFKFCDFFVWTDKDTFLETICVDTEIQADILSKTKSLFCNVLLPELVGKYFTNSINSDKSQDKWRICKMSEGEDDLIMCGSKTCKIQWFHIKCMRIKKITKGKRFCVKFKTKKDNCGNRK